MTPKGSGASRPHEVENVPALPAERGVDGQHPFDEATARHGMRFIAELLHDHAVTNHLLGAIVRRFNPVEIDEGPEGVAPSASSTSKRRWTVRM